MTTSLPKILIHEYISGGGWPKQELPTGLAAEGFSMLSAVVDDFNKWGKTKVYTTLDKRLTGAPVTADSITIISHEEYEKNLSNLAKECDFVLIIAPESRGILADLNNQVEQKGAVLLGCEEKAIRVTGNKWECHKTLSEAGLPVPETAYTNRYNALENALQIGFPLVIKPVDGVGCENVNLAVDMNSLRTILKNDPAYTDRVFLQEHIKGEHLSISILSTGKQSVCLSLNRQHINEGMPFKYLGGEIMPPPDEEEGLYDIVKKVMKVIPGLKGYIGIDLIRNEAGYKIIEINPRLTTSYVGLRKVININLAQTIFESVVDERLPSSIKISSNKVFNKELPLNYFKTNKKPIHL